jgi:D-arginine dehydrogenase
MREFDVIIAGAGIAGASLAWRLAAGKRVLLLERETQPGYHSTGRSAAMFMESYGPPGVRALTRASRSFYQQPPEAFTSVPLLAPRGVLYLATREQAAQMDALCAELAPCCPGLQRIDASEVLRRVPCLRPEVVLGALCDPAGEDIDVNALHQGFLRGLRQRGGQLRCGAALAAPCVMAAAGPCPRRTASRGAHPCW